MEFPLRGEISDLFLEERGILKEAFSIFNPVVDSLQDELDHETHHELDDAVCLAIVKAAEDAFLAGIRFMQDPASFVLEEDDHA